MDNYYEVVGEDQCSMCNKIKENLIELRDDTTFTYSRLCKDCRMELTNKTMLLIYKEFNLIQKGVPDLKHIVSSMLLRGLFRELKKNVIQLKDAGDRLGDFKNNIARILKEIKEIILNRYKNNADVLDFFKEYELYLEVDMDRRIMNKTGDLMKYAVFSGFEESFTKDTDNPEIQNLEKTIINSLKEVNISINDFWKYLVESPNKDKNNPIFEAALRIVKNWGYIGKWFSRS